MENYNFLIEATGAVTGLAGIYLTSREHPSCFPVGLLSVACSFLICLGQGFYSNAVLQVIFAVLLVGGWYNWKKKRTNDALQISKQSNSERLITISLALTSGILIGLIFSKTSGSQLPYPDGITTGLSIAAQYLVARKKIENWPLWVMANTLYVGMYFYSGLYLYSVLYGIYLVMAFTGWRTWNARIQRTRTA